MNIICMIVGLFSSPLVQVKPIIAQTWQSPSYYGNPIAEDAVGSIVFDPGIGTANPQCFGISGQINITLVSCPFGAAASYFNITSNFSVTLATPYYLSRNDHSPIIPDCQLACQDSKNSTVYTSLTISIYNTNSFSPVFNSTFPTFIRISDVTLPQFIVRTDAYDRDLDKTANGYVTYSVISIDGEQIISGYNNYLQYENNGTSPNLDLISLPPWTYNTSHVVVVLAGDHPRNISAWRFSYQNFTIFWGYYVPTAPTTTLSSWLLAQEQQTTTDCGGISFLICGDHWIYLIAGGCGFLVLVVTIILIACLVPRRRREKANKVRPTYQKRHMQKKERYLEEESEQTDETQTVSELDAKMAAPRKYADLDYYAAKPPLPNEIAPPMYVQASRSQRASLRTPIQHESQPDVWSSSAQVSRYSQPAYHSLEHHLHSNPATEAYYKRLINSMQTRY